ncbi:hypothetical protein [Photobacterium phosphoreum]|uniref:hypothetical protein n=1 Tax=Photobacterium phosphoreum TaxID=659 RepID=UPI001E44A1F0|nr:hypothetical protein [Photobacterium phosphoreum]MCD9479350.1 hypothetical protein [Photobacterium phosphoreum]MCD9517821.1 hypothetical protein [Photobacterium phosphoreum]
MKLVKVVLATGCGLSGLGAIIFFALVSKVMEIEALSKMTPEQSYNALIATIAGCLICLFMLIIVHLASKKQNGDSITASGSGHAIKTTGANSPVSIGGKD